MLQKVAATPSANQELRNAGLKITLPRVKVFQALASSSVENPHLSAEDVYRHLLTIGSDISLGTVYRTLTQLEAAGLVIRHHFDSGRSLFELTTGERHDHMVSLATGDIMDFSEPELVTQLQQIAQQHGYELADYALVLYVRKKGSR